jgi:beta-arrestin
MHNSFGRVSEELINQSILLVVQLSIDETNQFVSNCSDLVAELPFILMHPKPDDIDDVLINENGSPNNNSQGKSRNSLTDKQQLNNNSTLAKDDAPNLIQLDG